MNPARLICLALPLLLTAVPAQSVRFTFDGDAAASWFGYSTGGPGDIDKDGHADLAVGVRGDDANGVDAGGLRVFSGRSGKLLGAFYGDSAGDNMGWAVAGAGDVNGDTYPDVVVGMPLADGNGVDSGSVRVFSGLWLALRAGPQVLYTFDGDAAGDSLGMSVAGAGDVNRDGFADVIAGARFDDDKGTDCGMARVFSGKDGKVLFTFYGDSAGDEMGGSVAGAGDVDNDGFPDLIAGIFHDDDNGTDAGTARIFSGKDGRILFTFDGDSAGDNFGRAVAGTGDLNGDGHADVIVSAIFDDNKGTDSGMARVFSGKDGKVLFTFDGDSAGDRFGVNVAGAGDLNRDGVPDLVVGAYLDDDNGSNCGSARAFSGRDGSVLFTVYGDSANDQLGVGIAGAGDVDNDGFDDLLIGAFRDDNNGLDAGSARVVSGTTLPLTTDVHAFSLARANTQTLRLDSGAAHAGRLYQVFGSVTGTSPGVTLGGVTIPLIPDAWTTLTLAFANTPTLTGTRGTLDANGRATASINAGPVNLPGAVGVVFYHAALVYDASGYHLASNPVTLLLEK